MLLIIESKPPGRFHTSWRPLVLLASRERGNDDDDEDVKVDLEEDEDKDMLDLCSTLTSFVWDSRSPGSRLMRSKTLWN